MYQEKVSIIVPTYNAQLYIEKCIGSILEQSYYNIEIIIIDDGSNDKTGELCDNMARQDKRIIVKHIENAGVSNARNYGLSIATGRYIQFVDSDDIIDGNMTEKLVRRIQCDASDIVICGYNQYICDQLTKVDELEGKYNFIEFLGKMRRWMTKPIIGAPWNKLYKKEIIDKYSLSFDTTTSYAEDYLFNIEYMGYVQTVSVIKDRLYSYFIESKNSLHNVNLSDIEHVWHVNEKILDLNDKILKMHNVEKMNYKCALYNFLFNSNVILRVRTEDEEKAIKWISSNYNLMYSKYNKHYLDFLFFPKIALIGIFVKNIAKRRAENINYGFIKFICR